MQFEYLLHHNIIATKVHISHNIKTIRNARGETQSDFIKHFTQITLAIQKAYELGRTEPKNLYLTELAELSGIPEGKLLTKKITLDDVSIVKGKVEKVHVMPVGNFQEEPQQPGDGVTVTALLKAKDELIAEKDVRIKDLKEDKAFLQEILKTSLAKMVQDQIRIAESQGTVLAYQKAWVDQHAEELAKGDKVIEKQIRAKMGRRVGEHELGPVHRDKPSIQGK